MQTPKEQNPYIVETKGKQTLKFSRIDADNEAVIKQLDGDDVEAVSYTHLTLPTILLV